MRVLCVLAATLLLAIPAQGKVNSTDLSQWLPELPPFSRAPEKNRARHLDYWLQHVRPGMTVAQVLVMVGHPDWGVDTRGRTRWFANPRDGILQYSASGRDAYKGGGRIVQIHFNEEARVKRIVENGIVTAKSPRMILPGPLRRGVWWRP